MSRTTTQKEKNRAGFGRQGAVFQKHINNEMRTLSVSLSGRARQAFTLLVQAGTQGVTQAQALIAGNGWRLAASIHVLRRKGFQIVTNRVHRANGSWQARYVLSGLA